MSVPALKTLAIIVNFKSADLTLRAVRSVLDSASIGPVDVVVIDNSQDKNDAETLRLGLPTTVRLHVSRKNLGFGSACNLAYHESSDEHILLINPDAMLLPGSLARLQQTLISAESIAAVAPQVYWDKDLTYFLPPPFPPFLFFLQNMLGAYGPHARINRLLGTLWRSYATMIWRRKVPVRAASLSGALVLLKREAVQKAGGLFDPRFFIYFEDTDLSMRLRKAGYSLVIEPRAAAIHEYDQCGKEDRPVKRSLMDNSYNIFLEKYGRSWTSFAKKINHGIAPAPDNKENQPAAPTFTAPFVVEVPVALHKSWLFELSPSPSFIPSAGRFGKGPTMDFPEERWDLLGPGLYFGRLGKATALAKPIRTVSFLVS